MEVANTYSNKSRSRFQSTDEIRFVTEKKRPRKVVPVNYVKTKSETDIVPRLAWAFCLFLILRLVFADRGILDYWIKNNELNTTKQSYELIKKDNALLASEIKRIKKDSRYQKQILRDGLDVIEANEYVILFARDSNQRPI